MSSNFFFFLDLTVIYPYMEIKTSIFTFSLLYLYLHVIDDVE